MPPHAFGELLRRRRQHADLTIEGLSEQSGVSTRTISDIERGTSIGPQRRTVIALADALQLVDDDRAQFLSAARPGRRGALVSEPPVSVRPFRLPDFSGREAEMNVLSSLLTSDVGRTTTPIVVTGTAGVGKTTVALEALHRATADSSDVLFVNLRGFDALPLRRCRYSKRSCARRALTKNPARWTTPSRPGAEPARPERRRSCSTT